MSPAPLVAIALRPASPTCCSASRSACEYVVGATHIRCASVLSRFKPADGCVLACTRMRRCGRPGVGVVVDDVAARHRVDGDQQVGVDRQAHRIARPRRRGRPAGWSRSRPRTAACRACRRWASDVARSSSISRTGVVPPGTPAASRGRSAIGHSTVSRTGLEVSGGTTDVSVSAAESAAGSGGTPSTGSRKRASSRRAGAP